MLVHCRKDKAYRFKEFGKGLYYLNISNPETIPLTTESGNTEYYFNPLCMQTWSTLTMQILKDQTEHVTYNIY